MLANSAYGRKDGKIVESLSSPFRVSIKEGNDKLLFIEEGNEDSDHKVTLFINENKYSKDYDNIIFSYDAIRNIYIGAKDF